MQVPLFVGIAALAYSLLTAYELGAAPLIPMTGHLALDFFSGAFLAVSPWLLGFHDQVWIPHVLFGVMEMGAALTTETTPRRMTSATP
jgi:hypothetical protein